jgi:AcrR family transcriptional regulator
MAVSFSEKEKAGIIAALRQAAGRHAAVKGLRKTTVEELAAEAGISKGMFYKLYPSKEHLFLDMLEQWHIEISERAERVMRDNSALPAPRRAALLLKTALKVMRDKPLIGFCQDDLPFLIRKLPDDFLKEHYQSNEDFIRGLMNRAHVRLSVPENVAYAVVRILIFSLITASKVGSAYGQGVEELIDGVCDRIVKDD